MRKFKCIVCGEIHETPDDIIISRCKCGGKTERIE